MSEYYLSVDAYGNMIMHSGRKGMKWYQHIFTKDQIKNRSGELATEAKVTRMDKGVTTKSQRRLQRRNDQVAYKDFIKLAKAGKTEDLTIGRNQQRAIARGAMDQVERSARRSVWVAGPIGAAVTAPFITRKYNKVMNELSAVSLKSTKTLSEIYPSTKKSSGVIAMLTAEEAKSAGLSSSTRLTEKEEADAWKSIAAYYDKMNAK